MSDRLSLRELTLRMRAGDNAAAEEFMRNYEQPIRRRIRNLMYDTRLASHFDSGDVFQSAVIALLEADQDGRDVFEGKDNSMAVFWVIARRKLLDRIRKLKSLGRDIDPERTLSDGAFEPADSSDQILRTLKLSRLVDQVNEAPEDIRQIVESRLEGLRWRQIGEQLGLSEDAARKRLRRWSEDISPPDE